MISVSWWNIVVSIMVMYRQYYCTALDKKTSSSGETYVIQVCTQADIFSPM